MQKYIFPKAHNKKITAFIWQYKYGSFAVSGTTVAPLRADQSEVKKYF